MKQDKDIQYIIRRISDSDLRYLLDQTLMDQIPCYYKKKFNEKKAFEFYYRTVVDDVSDNIFLKFANYNLLNDDESTEEEEDTLIKSGIRKMFTKEILDYCNNEKCND